MTAEQIASSVTITDVAQALGITIRHGRCVAPWRPRADGWNVSLSEIKGVWFDHARGEGGGIVDFVARVRGCGRKAALEWLAAYVGIPLDHKTEAEQRQWARRMRAAEPKAKKLVAWKLETLEALRAQRNRLLRIYHRAVHFIVNHDIAECERRGDLRFEAALTIGWSYWPRIRELDKQINHLAAASYADLLRQFGIGDVA
jgi:hypothetical protein